MPRPSRLRAQHRKSTVSSDVGRVTARVLALWRDGKPKEALDLALVAQDKSNPDVVFKTPVRGQ
jgi:hypothetical protein